MDLKILPNEIYVTENGAIIRTRCPKENITDQMVHQRVIAANLSAGDTVKIQCMNHERSTVLYFAEYLVYDRAPEMVRVEVNDVDIKQFEKITYSIMKIGDWKSTPAAPQETIKQEKTGKQEVKWNVGKGKYDVFEDGVLVAEVGKEEAEKIKAA